jgi:hypothetical protein
MSLEGKVVFAVGDERFEWPAEKFGWEEGESLGTTGLIYQAAEHDLFVQVIFDTDGNEYDIKHSPEIVIFENSLQFQ